MSRRASWAVVPALVVMAACFAVPMGFVLKLSLQSTPDDPTGPARYLNFLADPYFRGIVVRTIRIGVLTTILTLILGYPVAYLVSRTDSRWRPVLRAFIFFPLITSAIVRTFGWMIIISDTGFLNQVLALVGIPPLALLYKDAAILIGLVHVLLPFMILTLMGSLGNIDPNLENAARSLGSPPLRAFRRVTLPMSLPGVVAGSVLVFALAVSAFVTPALLGGVQAPVMATMIYREAVVSYDLPSASAGAVLLLGTTLALIYGYNVISGRARNGRVPA